MLLIIVAIDCRSFLVCCWLIVVAFAWLIVVGCCFCCWVLAVLWLHIGLADCWWLFVVVVVVAVMFVISH